MQTERSQPVTRDRAEGRLKEGGDMEGGTRREKRQKRDEMQYGGDGEKKRQKDNDAYSQGGLDCACSQFQVKESLLLLFVLLCGVVLSPAVRGARGCVLVDVAAALLHLCLLYTSPSPRD